MWKVILRDGSELEEGKHSFLSINKRDIQYLIIIKNNKEVLRLENPPNRNVLFYQKSRTVNILSGKTGQVVEEAGEYIGDNKFRVYYVYPDGTIKEKIEEKYEAFYRIHGIDR